MGMVSVWTCNAKRWKKHDLAGDINQLLHHMQFRPSFLQCIKPGPENLTGDTIWSPMKIQMTSSCAVAAKCVHMNFHINLLPISRWSMMIYMLYDPKRMSFNSYMILSQELLAAKEYPIVSPHEIISSRSRVSSQGAGRRAPGWVQEAHWWPPRIWEQTRIAHPLKKEKAVGFH